MSTPLRRPADRYGEAGAPRRRRRVVAGVAVLAAAALAWVVWAGLAAAGREVRWETQGYDVVDDGTVVVTFTVAKDPEATARCEVEALSSTFARVGLTSADVGPAPQRGATATATVRTQERAVTGQVRECTVL
ncbi:DUF4307 domain-containing protein [Quadrisphaera sp. DSM 44207]|uniref:DUF4307 domain-containing protein n=1 Tax=Quadrisphaera sp. DSM 44207 TaxID=1881057 RepID=UPI000887FE60|nr:DUF4307 domain-containing protein [Quadrisphaera sp. DSM 44207]SDQ69366.1 protein of unknown function [Quadrisphaera sp. DSM 44207]